MEQSRDLDISGPSRIVGSFQLAQMLPAWLWLTCRRLVAGKRETGVAATADRNPKGPAMNEKEPRHGGLVRDDPV